MTHALLFLHLVSAFLFVAGAVAAGVLQIAALRRERPSEIALLLRTTRAAVAILGIGALGALAFGLALVGHEGIGFGTGWVVKRSCCGSSRWRSAEPAAEPHVTPGNWRSALPSKSTGLAKSYALWSRSVRRSC